MIVTSYEHEKTVTRKLLPCQSRTQESSGFLPEDSGYGIGNRATSQWIGSQPKQSFLILLYFTLFFSATCVAILPSVTYPVGSMSRNHGLLTQWNFISFPSRNFQRAQTRQRRLTRTSQKTPPPTPTEQKL